MSIFVFYVEIQDGGQKWRKTIAYKKCHMTVYNPEAKNFYEITLSHNFSKINVFLHLIYQTTVYTLGAKILSKSHRF